MSNEISNSTVKILVVVSLVMCLLFVVSCKKSGPADSPDDTGQQNTNASKDPGDNFKPTAEELVPLDTNLPTPVFVGTPKPVRVPNLEPLGKKRGTFLVPPDVENISLGKPVSSTDPEPMIGDLECITDGDKEAADGCYVELGPMKQSVTVDLEAKYEIYAILLWHYHKEAVVYFDVVVQVADDPDFITNVRMLFNSDIDNSCGLGIGKDKYYVETYEGKLIDAKGVTGRYVRLYSNGNSANEYNHYIEVEVFGRAVK